MTTRRPNEGNPRVRIDEGIGASALPRRGHLFGGGGRFRHGAAFLSVAFAAALPALAETWTFQKTASFAGGPTGNYDAANAWKDESGNYQAFDTAATVARTYLVPAGKTLISLHDEANSWQFTPNNDTFVLEGNSSSPAILASSTKSLTIPLLVMKDNARLVQAIQADASQTLLGAIRVDASAEYPAQIWGWGWQGRASYLSTTITGSGALILSENATGGLSNGTYGKQYLYDCDASGFTGPITMKIPDSTTSRNTPCYYVNNTKNLGGNPSEFTQKGLALAGVYLEFQGNVTLPANRGLYVGTHTSSHSSNAGRGANIGAASGRTFKVTTPVVFESGDFALGLTAGSGAFSLPGWTSNGTIALNTAMTLDITGARVANGTVTPALIGTLTRANTNSKVKLTLSGDGSELAEGRYTILSAVSLPANIDSFLTVVDTGAFTLPTGKKAVYSSEDGARIVLTVKDDCPTWTFAKTGGADGNYMNTNAWTSAGVSKTWTAETSATQIDYIIPKGYSFVMEPGDVNEAEFMLPQNADSTVTLYGTIEVKWIHTTIPQLVMKDSSRLHLWVARNQSTNFRKPRRVCGSVRIDASEATPAIFDTFAYFAPQVQTNALTMTGSGSIRYTHTARDSVYTDGQIAVTGNNSGFIGSVSICKTGSNAKQNMRLYVSSGENIGGNPATFKEKGLEIAGAYLYVQGDTALGENRGFYVSSNSTVDVSNGATFTVPSAVGFANTDFPLVKSGAGTMSLGGWAANGTVKMTTGTLEITGASVTNGVVTPASIGSLVVSGGTVKIVVTGDGSEVNLGDVKTLIDCGGTLDDGVADYLQFVNDGAFTFASGTKASLSVEDGKIKMSVVEYVPEWTLSKTGLYSDSGIWTDEEGGAQTWSASSAAIETQYKVPAGRELSTEEGNTDNTEFSFSTNPDSVFTLMAGTASSRASFLVKKINAYIPNLVMRDGAMYKFGWANNGSPFKNHEKLRADSIMIDSSEETPAVFWSQSYYYDTIRVIDAPISGTGALRFISNRMHFNQTHGNFRLAGDNSGYTGTISLEGLPWQPDSNNQKYPQQSAQLYVTNTVNIGGNPATFKEKGLNMSLASLYVQGDTALAANRGLYVSVTSTVDVASGKTFTVPTSIGFAEDTGLLYKTGAGTMSVPGWTNGTVAVSAGALNLTGATFANGAVGTPVAIGGIEYAGGATVTLTVTGDGSELLFANATNVLVEAESALPAGFAEKVQIVNDNAFTVSAGLKTKLIVIDSTRLALETKKRKGTLLIVR